MRRVPLAKTNIDPRRVNNFLDTCAFDPKYSPEDEAARAIQNLYANGAIQLLLAHSNQKETEHPNTPAEVKAEARAMNYTICTTLTDEELARKSKIHDVLTGNGTPEKYEADASHVFEAGKYGGYFVTTDERILAKREKLQALGGGIVFRPSEWMKLFDATADA